MSRDYLNIFFRRNIPPSLCYDNISFKPFVIHIILPNTTITVKQYKLIQQLSSQCVMCGICNASCPTYQQTLDENYSPRGRINMIARLDDKKTASQTFHYFDTCLQCMTCENICPSQVKYAKIISFAQQVAFSKQKKLISLNTLSHLILNHLIFRTIALNTLAFLQKLKLNLFIAFINRSLNFKLLSFFCDYKIGTKYFNTKVNNSTEVIIFTGCAQRIFGYSLLEHSLALFDAIGIKNISIDADNCCGALNKRKGDIKGEQRHINHLSSKYHSIKHIISLNSSCSSQLSHNSALNQSSFDIITYLTLKHIFVHLSQIEFKKFDRSVLVHSSCSVRNHLATQDKFYQLLDLIPNIQQVNLLNTGCCGASGDTMLKYPQLSSDIAAPYIDKIMQTDIHLMVSTDISCSVHIKQELKNRGYFLEVLHPISLLYRQLT